MGRNIRVLVVIAMTVMAACTSQSGDTITTINGRSLSTSSTTTILQHDGIAIGTTDALLSLDPAVAASLRDMEVIKNVSEGLLVRSPGGLDLVPGLAQTLPEVSEDGLRYTFVLREGLVFSDGLELTTEMLVGQINRVITLNREDPDPIVGALIIPFVENVIAVDDRTIEFVLIEPVAFFPQLVAETPYYPMHPDVLTNENGLPIEQVNGVGQWMITGMTENGDVTFEPNPRYHGDQPDSDRIVVRWFTSVTELGIALQTGEIDIAWRISDSGLAESLVGADGIRVEEVAGGAMRSLVLNHGLEPTNDPNVRRALAALIDRDRLVDTLGLGAQPTRSPIPSALSQSRGSEPAESLDTEAAREALEASGYTADDPLDLRIAYPPDQYGPDILDLMTELQTQLEASSLVDVELEPVPYDLLVEAFTTGDVYPVALFGWYHIIPDASSYLDPFVFEGGLGTMLTNPENGAPLDENASHLVELLRGSIIERDPAARESNLDEVLVLFESRTVTIPLWTESYFVLYRDGISGSGIQPGSEILNIGPLLDLRYGVLHLR